MAREWIDETNNRLLGKCWLPLDIGTLVLAAIGGGELLDIDIPTLVPLVFLLSMALSCLCNDDIKSELAHNSHTRGGGERVCKVTT